MTQFAVVDTQSGAEVERFENPQDAAARVREINEARKASGLDTRVKVQKIEVAAINTEELFWPRGVTYHDTEGGRWNGPVSWQRARHRTVIVDAWAIPASGRAWRKREIAKFENSNDKIPWSNASWWRRSPYWTLHYPRVSEKDPSFVCFTPEEAWGKANRQLRTSPGKYLKKYFGDVLNDAAIQMWTTRWMVANVPMEVQFAKTADEMEWVYVNGPHSCMAHEAARYSTPFHPVRVYAAGDLQVAWLKGAAGKPCARAVVWPERKLYGRLYGEMDRMATSLQAMGYSAGMLTGARLTRHPITRPGGGGRPEFVCPYIDHAYSVRDGGDYLIIDPAGRISAGRTDGRAGN